MTEVGCERNSSPTQSQFLQLFGPNILPRHCVIANTDGIVTVTPCSRDSETYVNGQRIYETTILRVSFCVMVIITKRLLVYRMNENLDVINDSYMEKLQS